LHERALHDHQRVALAGRLLRGADAVDILFLVAEPEHVGRGQLAADLAQRARVEEGLEPGTRPDRAVEAALRADLQVLLQLGAVQDGAAAVALFPQALGHAALAGRSTVGADAWRHQFLQPAHAWSAPVAASAAQGAQFSAPATTVGGALSPA